MLIVSGNCFAEEKREGKRFKGVELYSWKDKNGDWLFVMLDGTNRNKEEKEVKEAKEQFKGVAALKKALSRLAVGENLFWMERIKGFELPPKEILAEIAKAAKEAKLELYPVNEKE